MGRVIGNVQRIQKGGNDAISIMYSLCNRKQYFTHGSNEQYDKFFKMVGEKAPLDSIARVLWVCSDDKFSFNECYKDCYDNLMAVKEVY